jgi:hypothetical protein
MATAFSSDVRNRTHEFPKSSAKAHRRRLRDYYPAGAAVFILNDALPPHLDEIAPRGLRIDEAAFTVRVDTFGTTGVVQARYETPRLRVELLFTRSRFRHARGNASRENDRDRLASDLSPDVGSGQQRRA